MWKEVVMEVRVVKMSRDGEGRAPYARVFFLARVNPTNGRLASSKQVADFFRLSLQHCNARLGQGGDVGAACIVASPHAGTRQRMLRSTRALTSRRRSASMRKPGGTERDWISGARMRRENTDCNTGDTFCAVTVMAGAA